MCSNVRHYFKRDAKLPDYNVSFELSASKKRSSEESLVAKLAEKAPKMYCSTCDTMIDARNPLARDHLKYQCLAVPSPLLKPGFTHPELAARMAALATKKKLYTHNFTPHQSSTSTSEPGPWAKEAVDI